MFGSGERVGLFRVTKLGFFDLFFELGDVIKFSNKPMFVDKYHDTSWTRGRCPAAPPHIPNPAKRRVFLFGHLFGNKVKV